MKLRSIALAGILGAGLFMTSGCGVDNVTDIVNDALKTNIIHLANGQEQPVRFQVDGDLSGDEVVKAYTSTMVFVNGQDNYTVNNTTVDAPKIFSKESAHLYALCANDSVITDSATGNARKIEVINLSNTVIGTTEAGINVEFFNAVGEVLASQHIAGAVGACERATIPNPEDLQLTDVKEIAVSGVHFVIPDYDDDIKQKIDELNDVDFDVIVFDANTTDPKGAVVPLATPKELL